MPAQFLFPIMTLLLAGSPAARGEPGMEPIDLAGIQAVADVKISPDGRYIAFTRAVPRDLGLLFSEKSDEFEDGPAWVELHVVNVEDGRSRPFVTGEADVSAIDWTPDGRFVSFLAKRGKDKNKSLYVIPIDGGEARRVMTHETDIQEYRWHPKGGQVAYIAPEKEPKEIKKRQDQGFKSEVFEERLLYGRLWIADVRTGDPHTEQDRRHGQRNLFCIPGPRMLEMEGDISEIHWSPDGGRLAVTIAPTPLTDDRYMNRKLAVVDAVTGGVAVKFDNPGKLGMAAWSPDGRRLAVLSAEDRHDPSEGCLMTADFETETLKNVLPGFEGHVTRAAWQDAETVMYVADEGLWTTFNKFNVVTGEQKTIVPAGGPILSNLTLSRDGQSAAFTASTPQHPAEIFFMKHGDSSPRRMTDSNPWLAGIAFAKQETVTFQARDGLELQGVLIHPLNREENRRYPLLLMVHGGPEAHDPCGWTTTYSRPGQVAAAHGFAVFFVNYRGSTGRGVAFSKLGQADYGGKEFDDLVDAARHLVNTGLADEKKVGITGGSYGGYAAAWGATALSEHFAAAVMFVGVSDHLSKFGTTDIPQEWHLVHSRQLPWEGHWQWFLERSPIYHAGKSRTPILILHGKDDPRVPAGQSMELYRYLKSCGKAPVRLVYYPGEGHGNRKTAARYDYCLRLMQWMKHYLTGPGGDPPAVDPDYGFPVEKAVESRPASEGADR